MPLSKAMSDPPSRPSEPSREQVWNMFNRIAPRYDLLNRLLSWRLDVGWRRAVAARLPGERNLAVLDLATGTGDQLLALAESGRLRWGVGLDPAEEMLARARTKLRQHRGARLELRCGSAERIPYPQRTFDAVTIAFGIRNVTDVRRSLAEMYRVLKPGGRVLILEFSQPTNPVFRTLHRLYVGRVVPFVGGLVSGDRYAYRYLDRTIATFPSGQAFCNLLRECGFTGVEGHPLTFGVATIYQGDRP